jgi:hypothetical protein
MSSSPWFTRSGVARERAGDRSPQRHAVTDPRRNAAHGDVLPRPLRRPKGRQHGSRLNRARSSIPPDPAACTDDALPFSGGCERIDHQIGDACSGRPMKVKGPAPGISGVVSVAGGSRGAAERLLWLRFRLAGGSTGTIRPLFGRAGSALAAAESCAPSSPSTSSRLAPRLRRGCWPAGPAVGGREALDRVAIARMSQLLDTRTTATAAFLDRCPNRTGRRYPILDSGFFSDLPD